MDIFKAINSANQEDVTAALAEHGTKILSTTNDKGQTPAAYLQSKLDISRGVLERIQKRGNATADQIAKATTRVANLESVENLLEIHELTEKLSTGYTFFSPQPAIDQLAAEEKQYFSGRREIMIETLEAVTPHLEAMKSSFTS